MKNNNFNRAAETAKSFMKRVNNPGDIHWVGQTNSFSWQAGYIMFVLEKLWKATGDQIYFDYIKKYVDMHVDAEGNVQDFNKADLDNYLPGYAIIFMFEQTGLEKYKIAAQKVYEGFKDYPGNSDGSFWHGAWAKHQLWIDGLFMAQIFSVRYGKKIGDRENAFHQATNQIKLGLSHCLKENGLLLHGWDESKEASWANKNTGLASEVWSEGLGWVSVLLVDLFDFLPVDHIDYNYLMSVLKNLCYGLKKVQDKATGLWCQVVDKPDLVDNWYETSGTGMFIYLIKKSIEKGYIDQETFLPVVQTAYEGIIKKGKISEDGVVSIIDCSSIGIMDNYTMYVTQLKEIDTFAGIASFILGTSSMETCTSDY